MENTENPLIVFDWGLAVVNGGILDIAYLLAQSVPINLRRKIEKDMVKYFMKQLEQKGITGFDFDFAWENYLKALMCFAYIPVLGYAQLDRSDPRAMKIFEIITRPSKIIFYIPLIHDFRIKFEKLKKKKMFIFLIYYTCLFVFNRKK